RRAEPSLVRFGELLGGLTDGDERGEKPGRNSVIERGSDADGEVTRAHRLGRMRLDLELPERSTRLGQRTLGRAFSFALATFGLEHERHGGDRVPCDRAQREMEGDAWKLRNADAPYPAAIDVLRQHVVPGEEACIFEQDEREAAVFVGVLLRPGLLGEAIAATDPSARGDGELLS